MERILNHWLPYCGAAPSPGVWLTHWNFAPEMLACLVVFAGLAYWKRDRVRAKPTYTAAVVFSLLYISPFCALGSALFTVRIVHDVILATLLAPLIVAAFRAEETEIPGTLTVWTAVHGLTFWLWHAPLLYESAMSSDGIFWLMQISIVATAAIWWIKVIRSPAPAAATALLATMVAMGALGALLTFAHRAYFAPHWLTTQSWGLSPMEDQQIAGIVMWAPASLVYLIAALSILYRSLGSRAPA